jgi:hypothetical protein
MEGFERTDDCLWICDHQTLEDLISRAMAGDKPAQRMACAMAGEYMQVGKPLPVSLSGYIAGSLWRFGNEDCSLNLAFAPLGRVPKEITQARKRASDSSLVYWVDHAIASGLTTSQDGEPGPAFEQVAESFGLSPSTIRDRYYHAKQKRNTDPNVQIWKTINERANKQEDS